MATLLTWHEIPSGGRPTGGTIRESLQDYVTNLAVQETPLLSRLPQVQVNSHYV